MPSVREKHMSLGLRDRSTMHVLFSKYLGRHCRRAANTYFDRATMYGENSSAFVHFTLLGFPVWRFPRTALPSVYKLGLFTRRTPFKLVRKRSNMFFVYYIRTRGGGGGGVGDRFVFLWWNNRYGRSGFGLVREHVYRYLHRKNKTYFGFFFARRRETFVNFPRRISPYCYESFDPTTPKRDTLCPPVACEKGR